MIYVKLKQQIEQVINISQYQYEARHVIDTLEAIMNDILVNMMSKESDK